MDVQSIADVNRLAYVGRQPGLRDSDSWYTPAGYCDLIRQALGGTIDLDPFTSRQANETVQARRILTVEDNAMLCPWPPVETVFMNPPYSAGCCATAVARFVREFKAGTFREGVVLVNNATETGWFQQLASVASAICFPNCRIRFDALDGKRSSKNTRGQTFFFLGLDPARFIQVMRPQGLIAVPMH